MKKTGIYSGSFNPVHIGHLALANWLCAYEDLDEIWFLVTPQNPLKKQEDLIDDDLRLEMVKKAIGDYEHFIASDFEFRLPKPTYSITTMKNLEKSYPDREFYFIMGADNWSSITRWKEYKELITAFPVLIYPRTGYNIEIPDEFRNIKAVDAPLLEISSTFIRESFRNGKDVRFFLPEAVRQYFIND